MNYKKGDLVLVTRQSDLFGVNPAIKPMIENKLYGVVHNVSTYNSYSQSRKEIPYCYINFDTTVPSMNPNGVGLNIEAEFIKPLPQEELETAKKRITDYFKTKLIEDKNFIKSLIKPKVGYLVRSISHKEKNNVINTGFNAIRLGKWNIEKDIFTTKNSFRNSTVCCAITKTTDDLEVYIPKLWLDFYGYSKVDLQRWLDFLAACDINFTAKLVGLAELPNDLNSYTFIKDKKFIEDGYVCNRDQKPATVIPYKKDYFVVRLKASESNLMHTYLRFICLRYIYNAQYWSIPATAMQIKKALGNKVTHWQALLMAHARTSYNNYYSFAQTSDLYVINMFQKPEHPLGNLRKGANMNSSFEMMQVGANFGIAAREKLFEAKEYLKIYNIFKENIKK